MQTVCYKTLLLWSLSHVNATYIRIFYFKLISRYCNLMNAIRSDFFSKFHLFLFWNAVHRICPKWIFELLIHRWRLWTLLNHIGWLVFLELFQKSNYNQHPFWVSSTSLLLFLNNIIIDLINTKFFGQWMNQGSTTQITVFIWMIWS